MIAQVRSLGVPTVDLYHEDETQDIPGVATNQESLVRLAVEHFLDRGFRNFAYCGFPRVLFSDLRAACFAGQLARRGFAAQIFTAPPASRKASLAAVESHTARLSAALGQWLRDLPKPAALLACNDVRAQQVLAVCEEFHIVAPDEIAVLGIDNDDVVCDLCNPALSSIDMDVEQIGFEAAALLDRILHGTAPPRQRVLVEPAGVIVRGSTDALAIADREAAKVVHYVREHACDTANIDAILAPLNLSRSTLDRWFRKWLGRPPGEEIMRVRLNRVKELLATTQLPLDEIAVRAGFRHVESLHRVVKRATGQTPGQYRQHAQQLAKMTLTVTRRGAYDH